MVYRLPIITSYFLHLHISTRYTRVPLTFADSAANMTGFTDLSNEIVREVLKVVLPEDLENFAQTSRQVFLQSKPLLDEHRRLIRLYTVFTSYPPPGRYRFTERQDGWSVGPVPTLFKDILSQPRLGHYIREVKLDTLLDLYQMCASIKRNKLSDETRALYKQHRDLVDAAVAQSDVPEVRDQHERIKDGPDNFQHGGEELLVALMLPLLPNLSSLSVKWNADPDSYFFKMIQHGALNGTPWLTNLTTVRLEERNFDDEWLCLRDLGLFNSLPSLKSLTAFRIVDDLDPIDKYVPPQDSHTTELKLLSAEVSTRELYWYLKSFQRLQNFTLEHVSQESDRNDREYFDVGWINSALVSCAKATLQTLTILGPPRSDSFMGSLQVFEALREISIDWGYLFPNKCSIIKRPSRALPASLHSLKLRDNGGFSGGKLTSFFQGIQRAKKETCLHMKTVEVRTERCEVRDPAKLEHWYGFCQTLGMSLTWQEVDISWLPERVTESRLSLTFSAES